MSTDHDRDSKRATPQGRGRRGIRLATAAGAAALALALAPEASAEGWVPTWSGWGRSENPADVATTLEILLLLTILGLAPTLLVMTTAFTRIVIVLSFLRQALATQALPPNNIIIGLSLILTFLVMTPTIHRIKSEAVMPYLDSEITQAEAFDRAVVPLREFMFSQTREKDLKLFLDLSKTELPDPENVLRSHIPTAVLVPSFVVSELRRSFIMGFALFLPFVIIDLVVSSTLISMGMLVLPPILISLPFKILLFVLVDGWHLLVGSLVHSFQVG